MRTTIAIVPLGLVLACGGAPASAPRGEHDATGSEASAGAANEPPATAPSGPVQTCALGPDLDVALAADPARLALQRWGSACVVMPPHEPPLEWMVSVEISPRDPAREPSTLVETHDRVVGQGTTTFLGAPRTWIATREEIPGIGPAELRLARAPLTRHDVELVIALGDGAPEVARASAMEIAARLELRARIATDAWPYDPRRPICRGQAETGDADAALQVTVPDGARLEPSFVGSCALYGGASFEDAEWSITVGPVPGGPEWADLRDRPDGAQRALLGDPPVGALAAQGTITWLGAAAPWYAAELEVDGRRRVAAITVVRAHGRAWYAMITLRPERRAELPRVLAILESASVVE